MICPSCGLLVGASAERCPHCGRRRPGMWGLTAWLAKGGIAIGFTELVIGACVVLYLAALALHPAGIELEIGLGFLSPGGQSLFALGASGLVPVLGEGRWWTLLSAGWLHGGLLHIGFNMLWVRQLAPAVGQVYGGARATIIYVLAGAVGFAFSTIGPFAPGLVRMVMGAGPMSVGASAPVFGLLGALVLFTRRSPNRMLSQTIWGWVIGLFVFGLVIPGVDNWAHLGGFVGGWLTAHLLDPLKPERGDHRLIAGLLLLGSLAAVVASLVDAWPLIVALRG